MKKLLFVFCILGTFFSCSSDDDVIPSLVGVWKLSEINNDPGDGSGTFHKIKSDKIIVFKDNKEITSNGSLCDNTIISDSPSSGTYKVSLDSIVSGEITPSACNYNLDNLKISFKIEGSILYVSYPCIEGCAAKYVKEE